MEKLVSKQSDSVTKAHGKRFEARLRMLCVSAHLDDTELGMGATLNRHMGSYSSARLVVLSKREKTRGEKQRVGAEFGC
jgi:LmbE family N-acetylglucosaminyl deacetylase